MASDRASSPIGLFDSGVGGLSVLLAVRRELPHEDLIYFADQKYCPYGPRPADEIRELSRRIVRFLLTEGCKAVIVACNTASAAALKDLRATWPEIPFIGMEPAVKPAAGSTRTGKVGVFATKGTLEGELFQQTRDRHAREVEVLIAYPPDWVERVERGDIDSPETEESVRRSLQPFLDAGVDEIALGCTHYPFLTPLIRQVSGDGVQVLDPSQAVARQTARVLAERRLLHPQHLEGTRRYFTSGNAAAFALLLARLVGERASASHAEPA